MAATASPVPIVGLEIGIGMTTKSLALFVLDSSSARTSSTVCSCANVPDKVKCEEKIKAPITMKSAFRWRQRNIIIYIPFEIFCVLRTIKRVRTLTAKDGRKRKDGRALLSAKRVWAKI
jgi:hypothetical protein